MKLQQAGLVLSLLSSPSYATHCATSALKLHGVAEAKFNKAHEPFNVRSSCHKLKPSTCSIAITNRLTHHRVVQRDGNVVVTPDGITITRQAAGHINLAIDCQDVRRQHVAASYALSMGQVDMPVQVVNDQEQPVPGAQVTARLGSIFQQQTTNASGLVTLTNLPTESIELSVTISGHDQVQAGSVVPKPAVHQIQMRQIGMQSAKGTGLDSSQQCGACTPDSPMCQPTCQNPPLTCDFYIECAEQTLHCGPNGYPLHWGDRMCRRFESRLDHFSQDGRQWIRNTMRCLQKALIPPLSQCNTTCDSLQDNAFASHPKCYLDNGVCHLALSDMVQLIIVINTAALDPNTLRQIRRVLEGCIEDELDRNMMTSNEL